MLFRQSKPTRYHEPKHIYLFCKYDSNGHYGAGYYPALNRDLGYWSVPDGGSFSTFKLELIM